MTRKYNFNSIKILFYKKFLIEYSYEELKFQKNSNIEEKITV